MLKKFFIFLLTTVLIILPFSVMACAEEIPTISLSAPKNVYADEEFPVNLMISNNSKVNNATIVIEYDTSMLELVSCNYGSIYNSSTVKNIEYDDGKITLVFVTEGANSIKTDGALLRMLFIAREDAGGDCAINLSTLNTFDVSGNSLDFELVGAPIYITANQVLEPGAIPTETTTIITETESSTFVEITTKGTVTNDVDSGDEKPSAAIFVVIAVAGVAVLGVGIGFLIYNNKKQKGD